MRCKYKLLQLLYFPRCCCCWSVAVCLFPHSFAFRYLLLLFSFSFFSFVLKKIHTYNILLVLVVCGRFWYIRFVYCVPLESMRITSILLKINTKRIGIVVFVFRFFSSYFAAVWAAACISSSHVLSYSFRLVHSDSIFRRVDYFFLLAAVRVCFLPFFILNFTFGSRDVFCCCLVWINLKWDEMHGIMIIMYECVCVWHIHRCAFTYTGAHSHTHTKNTFWWNRKWAFPTSLIW